MVWAIIKEPPWDRQQPAFKHSRKSQSIQVHGLNLKVIFVWSPHFHLAHRDTRTSNLKHSKCSWGDTGVCRWVFQYFSSLKTLFSVSVLFLSLSLFSSDVSMSFISVSLSKCFGSDFILHFYILKTHAHLRKMKPCFLCCSSIYRYIKHAIWTALNPFSISFFLAYSKCFYDLKEF